VSVSPLTTPPTVHRTFLAFDFGTKRVGVASGNTVTRTAAPLRTLAAEGTARFDAIGKLVTEWKPDAPSGWKGTPRRRAARQYRPSAALRPTIGRPLPLTGA